MAATVSVDDLDSGEGSLAHNGACTNCRRKKQRCSRQIPCRTCLLSGNECIYEEGQRRGAKIGYIEALTKRMETLEALVLGQTLLLAPSLAGTADTATLGTTLGDQLHAVRESLLRRRKRPRTESAGSHTLAQVVHSGSRETLDESSRQRRRRTESTEPGELLPPASMLQVLIDIYFARIHPWIPILHEPTYAAAVRSKDGKPPLIILQAITAVTIKFYPLDEQKQESYRRRCHEAVVLTCMDRFSVESLQASVIIAFNTIGNGRGPRSWSIVASATRIVEQLGLAVEEEDTADNKLLNRIGFLPPAKSWTEAESLRRIFWSVFLLDRLCSVATGWNTSLTSTDVKRRLPVEGCLWRDGIEKNGRYFNIADHNVDSEDETNVLGGFAYLVEASECLTRVVTFLLRESVDFSAGDGLRRWFERFQSLDAMLVRWKTFLPLRWQVAGLDATGCMDENLTLAHITHNTSVIMLHQNIAYPDETFRHRLPSEDAAKTCLLAAGEIATIAAKFIANTIVIIPPAFSFCLFVAARAFLAHANHFKIPFDPNLNALLDALRGASKRWRGEGSALTSDDLAGQFADRIEAAIKSGSTINVRSAAVQEDGGQPISLASPPFPDVFRISSADAPTSFDASGIDAFSLPNIDMDTFDRIFTWTDETTGAN